jgi:hypothetical protein
LHGAFYVPLTDDTSITKANGSAEPITDVDLTTDLTTDSDLDRWRLLSFLGATQSHPTLALLLPLSPLPTNALKQRDD